ncbi:MAG: EamA family transporter [Bacteroidia bacterium]
MTHKKQDNTTAWILILLLALIWGSSFILMKRGLKSFSFDEVAALRMLSAFIVVIPFAIRNIRQVKSHQWKYLLASGMFGNMIPSFLFPFAQTMVASSMAGMLNSLTPVFVLLLGKFIFGISTKRSAIYGVVVGLASAVALILIRTQGAIGSNPAYGLYIVLACICYALSVNILRKHLHELDPVLITGFALMFAGIPCTIYLFSTDFLSRINSQPEAWQSFAAICTLGMLGSGLSTVLFNKLLKMTTALAASSVTYLIPIVSILWGLWDHETIGIYHLIAMTGILGGVYLINKK